MKINKQEIKTKYLKLLSIYREDIQDLDASDRAEAINYAKSYYNYLASANISYVNLALDVIEDRGKFGKLANIHLKHQSIFEGIKPEEFNAVRERIIIMLAYKDAKMRSSIEYHQSNPCYNKIEEYHKKVFESHTTFYAWGGLAPKVLIGSGSWMGYYLDNKGIFDGIKDIIKQDNIYKSSEYSVERMLQSVVHSYRIYSLGVEMPFAPKIHAASLEHAAGIWKLSVDRITKIKEDTSMFDSVSSKAFQINPANNFTATRDPYYTSGSDSENDDEAIPTLGANQVINEKIKSLLSNHNKQAQVSQESIEDALCGLKLAELYVPGMTKSCLETVKENYDFIQELTGITDTNEVLAKVQKSEQEIEIMQQDISNLVGVINAKQSQDQSVDDENANWLNSLLANTKSAMDNLDNDSEMQQYLQGLSFDSTQFDSRDL